MDIKQETSKRLRAAREATKLTMADVCARIPGLTVSRLGNWEQGTRTMPNDFAKKLAKVYEVSAAWLVCLEDEKQGDQQKGRLLEIYDQLDARGRGHLLRVAESEQEYVTKDEPGRQAEK